MNETRIEIGDLVVLRDGTEAVVVRLGDETDCPWWQAPVHPRNERSIQVRPLAFGRLRWIARSQEGRRWSRIKVGAR